MSSLLLGVGGGGGGCGGGGRKEYYLKDAADGVTGVRRFILLETGDALLLE